VHIAVDHLLYPAKDDETPHRIRTLH
jgi:hypothetical protein